jgi:hypothetical protein
MARAGGIVFIQAEYGDLETFQTLGFAEGDEKVLITDLWEFRDCSLTEAEVEVESEATSRKILAKFRIEIGEIM